jgi:TRAP-type uncharacterized transport system substrate-binding protein
MVGIPGFWGADPNAEVGHVHRADRAVGESMRKHHSGLALVLIGLVAASTSSWAQVARAPAARAPITAVAEGEGDEAERANKWTVGLAGGLVDGAYIKFASDVGTALDDGDNLRVLTILTKGSVQNVHDLLYLKGVDAGLVSADTFEQFKKEGKIRNIEERIQYISQVHVNTIQVLARPDIKSLKDLAGKKVAVAAKGSSSAALALKILERYNLKVEVVESAGFSGGMEMVKSGECVAAFTAFAKGAPTVFSSIPASTGLHLLAIDFDKFADEYYVPVSLDHNDYPNLITAGERIETLGSPVVLAVYNWPQGTDRFRKVQRFVDYYFKRFDKLKKPPFQPQWKEVNLAATVPGWKRYWYAEEVLKTVTTAQQNTAGETEARVLTGSSGEDQKLFNEFLEWKKARDAR